jgi:S-DNA-T family DNA segregation ATPase FtsK/SpoIIIE
MNETTKKDTKSSMLFTCTYSVLGGALISAVYPPWAVIGTILYSGGFAGMAYMAVKNNRFDKVFRNLELGMDGAYPFLKKRIKTDYSTVYKFTLPCGLCLSDFEDKQEQIEQYLGREISIKYTYKEIQIEVFETELKSLYEYDPVDIKGEVPILIGYNRKDVLISCDLSDGEPHLGIYGETGSGKSTVLRSIITNLILKSKVKLHLVDLKNGAEFNIFRKSSKVESFCRNIKEAKELLLNLSIEVDRRYDLFFEKDVKDIKEYNKKFKYKKLDYQVLIIDEFADLQSDKDKSCIFILQELGRKARACGIHVILSTQRPSSKVLDSEIKANITNILGLKTLNNINSQIIIDEPGLEKLRGKGHGIFKRGVKVEVQAPFLEPDKARELIKHTYVEKKVIKPIQNGELQDFSCLEAYNDYN